jgi:enoyl-CoA hydratase
MAERPVLLSVRDEVAWVQLARPPVNALDAELVASLAETVLEATALEPHAMVFSGGARTLAAGGDVKWMYERGSAGDRGALRGFLRAIQRLFEDIERLPMPTIALVRGPTLGGGFELAMACDMRIAADDSRVGFPEATLGLLPGAGGTQRLTEAVGRGIALELLYTGRLIDAAEALRLGLLNRVCPADELEDAATELLEEVLRSTPEARAAIKVCVLASVLDGRRAGLETETAGVEQLGVSPVTLERLLGFQERRRTATA